VDRSEVHGGIQRVQIVHDTRGQVAAELAHVQRALIGYVIPTAVYWPARDVDSRFAPRLWPARVANRTISGA